MNNVSIVKNLRGLMNALRSYESKSLYSVSAFLMKLNLRFRSFVHSRIENSQNYNFQELGILFIKRAFLISSTFYTIFPLRHATNFFKSDFISLRILFYSVHSSINYLSNNLVFSDASWFAIISSISIASGKWLSISSLMLRMLTGSSFFKNGPL